MDEFVVVFRQPSDRPIPPPEQRAQVLAEWDSWFASIEAKGRLVPGKRLELDGRVIRNNDVVTDGPFVEIKELLSGFIIVLAQSLDEATALAMGCPILKVNGSVEVRRVIPQRP